MMKNSENINNITPRPQSLDDFVGQKEITDNLKIFIAAIKKRGSPSDHLLLYGPPGTGKTTLARIIANEIKSQIRITSGAALTKTGDLAAILTNMKDNDIFFIDEIHRLLKPVEEMLYPVLEDYRLDIVIGKGPAARVISLSLPRILIIGATTKLALISTPLRDRFGLVLRLNYYNEHELKKIVLRTSIILNIPISEYAALEIAKRSRKTPRIALKILKRAKDYFEVKKAKIIDEGFLNSLFNLLKLDNLGLTPIDWEYLNTLKVKFNNQPVGLSTIAASLSEEEKTIEESIEPYLLRLGLIKKTSRGRVLTPLALKYLKEINNGLF
jgi:Holliday junction DNA helicase RuvB